MGGLTSQATHDNIPATGIVRMRERRKMNPHKKGSQWEISYRAKGYDKVFTERYDSYDEADKRCATIKYEKKMGTFIPREIFDMESVAKIVDPYATFSEVLDRYVSVYGAKKWKPGYASVVKHRINDYIKPVLGDIQIKMLSEAVLTKYFDDLYDTKAVPQKGRELCCNVSPEIIKKIYYIISGVCSFAKDRGYITANPTAGIKLSGSSSTKKVVVWTSEETLHATSVCKNRILRLCIMIAFYCTLRVGELTALRWDHVNISDEAIENGTACIYIDRELQRCNVDELEDYRRRNPEKVYYVFPNIKPNAKTVLAILVPKTEGSIRTIYLPRVMAEALREEKAYQEELKRRIGGGYKDYDLVVAFDNGRPVEENKVNKMLKAFCEETGLRRIHFHSLRHTSITEKLRQSGGDIKSVQGDAGHNTAKMVTDQYAEIQDEPRRDLARKMDRMGTGNAHPIHGYNDFADKDVELACEILCQNPALASMLIAASSSMLKC